MRDDGCFRQSRRRRHDESFDRLAHQRIGDANDRGILNSGKRIKDILDFPRSDLFAAAFDDVILAADKIEVTLFIGLEQITAITDSFSDLRSWTEPQGAELRSIPITPHHMPPANHQFAHFTGAEPPAV